jgi:adenosylmethionine-8-amino-7-oxononanoate aminotransferase
MCVQFWKLHGEMRTTFLALEHSYHGDTFGAMAVSARSPFSAAFGDMLFSVQHLPFPEPPLENTPSFSEAEELFLTELEKACSSHTVAAFIFEPLLLGSGGMKLWRAMVAKEALRIATQYGVLTIADEVLTGFGRTGEFFACDHFAGEPDIMVLSKGLTGGFMPLGATLVSSRIFEAFLSSDRSHTFFHGHSFTGNPMSCAAAVQSLQLFDTEPVDARIQAISKVHHAEVPSLAESKGMHYRLLGTMAALQPKNPEGYLSLRSLDLSRLALERGVLLRPLGDTIYLLPPYSTTAEDLSYAYSVMDEIL